MANFVALFGGDDVRRARAMRRAGDLAPLPHLVEGCLEQGALWVRWSAGAGAPVHAGSAQSQALVCFGDAFDPESGAAHGVMSWLACPSDAPSAGHDGYFACLRLDAEGVGQVEADHLGLFPVFYAPCEGMVAVASSQETLVRILDGNAALDPIATAGVLLTCAGFGDATPWRTIRRLRPGHRLTIRPDGGTVETPQSPQVLPHDKRVAVCDDSEGEAQLYAALRTAVARQTARRPARLLLSGGIDSRILAGICRDLEMRPSTLTLGTRSDLETLCARKVAHHLRWNHHGYEPLPEQVVAFAQASAQWNHLDAGACHLGWEIGAGLAEGGDDPALTGMCLDGVIYGTGGPSPERQDFDHAFSSFWNARGIEQALLGRLLRPAAWRDAVAQAHDALAAYWRDAGPDDFSRTFVTHLHHRNRTQIGACLWQLSFRAWPILPLLSRDFLLAANRLSSSALHDGRLRQALLRRRWPDLARLPIDSNRYRTAPLIASPRDGFETALGKVRAFQALAGWERRRYVRGLDLCGANWLALRATIGQPERWSGWLDPELLGSQISPPRRPTHRFDTVIGHAAGRHLIHLLIWADRHAPAIEATLGA